MKAIAVVVGLIEGVYEGGVHYNGLVERAIASLLGHEDAIVELLTLQYRVEEGEQCDQVVLPVPIRYYDCNLLW